MRQLEFGLLILNVIAGYQPSQPTQAEDILALAQTIREEVAVILPPEYHRFPHSFSHIFAGGYGGGLLQL